LERLGDGGEKEDVEPDFYKVDGVLVFECGREVD
jgi:hypothetical protein